MALEKLIPTDYGVGASYWKIVSLNADFPAAWAQVTVAGYVDKTTKESSITMESPLDGSPIEQPAQPLRSVTLALPLTDNTTEVTREMLYNHLKTLPFFEGALDA